MDEEGEGIVLMRYSWEELIEIMNMKRYVLLLIQFLWLIGMLCIEIDIKMENEVLLVLLLQITSGGEASNHSFLVSRTL